MPSAPSMERNTLVAISRRQLFLGSVIGLASTQVAWHTDRAEALTPNSDAEQTSVLVGGGIETRWFSQDFSTAFAVSSAALLTITGVEDAQSIILEFSWDSRAFTASSNLAVKSSSGVHMLAVGPSVGESTSRFEVPRSSRDATSLDFISPITPVALYPNDGIDDVQLPTLRVLVDDRIPLEQPLATVVESAVLPWAVTLTAAWDVVASTASAIRQYRAPVGIQFASAGPNPVPVGTAFQINVDEAFTNSPSLLGVENEIGEDRRGAYQLIESINDGRRQVLISVVEEIPAGETNLLTVQWPALVFGDVSSPVTGAATIDSLSVGTDQRPRRNIGFSDESADTATSAEVADMDVSRVEG